MTGYLLEEQISKETFITLLVLCVCQQRQIEANPPIIGQVKLQWVTRQHISNYYSSQV